MFRILLALSISALISICLNLVTLINNEWYSVYMRNNNCLLDLNDQCILPGYFKVFTIGLWFMCPTTGPYETTWVFNSDLNSICLPLQAYSKTLDRIAVPGIISKYLKENSLIDIEPSYIDIIQALNLIGTVILLFTACVIIGLLIYIVISVDKEKNYYIKEQYRSSDNLFDLNVDRRVKKKFYSNYSKFEYIKPYLQAIFVLHVFELSCRLCAFILYSIRVAKYLDEVARTSYSIITGNDYYDEKYDSFIQNILKYYSVTMNWSWWLQLSSLILSFGALVLIVIFYVVSLLVKMWKTWKRNRNQSQINEFINIESNLNRYPVQVDDIQYFSANDYITPYVPFEEVVLANAYPITTQDYTLQRPNDYPANLYRDETYDLTSPKFYKNINSISGFNAPNHQMDKQIESFESFKGAKYFETIVPSYEPTQGIFENLPQFHEVDIEQYPKPIENTKQEEDAKNDEKKVRFSVTETPKSSSIIYESGTLSTDSLNLVVNSPSPSLSQNTLSKEYDLNLLNESSNLSDTINSDIYTSISASGPVEMTKADFKRIIIREKPKNI